MTLPPRPCVILSGAKIPGYPTPGAEAYPVEPDGLTAICERWPVDAHLFAAVPPGVDHSPRINDAALPELIAAGREPEIWFIAVDCDNPDHAPHANPAAELAACEQIAKLARSAAPGSPLATCGVYTTRAGLRLLWQLEEPLKASVAGSYMTSLCHLLIEQGVSGVDKACTNWGRLFRLPYVKRDGKPTNPVMDLSRMALLAWKPAGNLRSTQMAPSVRIEDAGDAPTDISPPTEMDWLLIQEHKGLKKYLPNLRSGRKLAAEGARDNTLTKVIALLVQATEAEDPTVPFRYVLASVQADTSEGAPSVAKAWGRCIYYCERMIGRKRLQATFKDSPPIVYSGPSSFYVLDALNGGYRPSVSAVGLCQTLETYAVTLGIQTRTEAGAPRDAASYVADYGRQALKVYCDMGRAVSTFDPVTGEFMEAVCRPLDIPAVEHPDVAEWLAHFAGANVDTLLDWLATVRQLDKQTCALYLQGPPGGGKTMFVQGVSALWGAAPCDYQDVMGAFNGALCDSPIVFADESMAGRERNFSTSFRKLIGTDTRQLTRKFMPAATLRGAIRLVVAANNNQGLAIAESLTAQDIQAIADRIAYIRVSPAAESYLQGIGQRTGTAEWVRTADGRPGRIAEHIVWLEQTRKVAGGGRWLVKGSLTDFHRDLALNAGLNPAVLACIATVLTSGRATDALHYDPTAPDVLGVNTGALRAHWNEALGQFPPDLSTLGEAIRGLASEEFRRPRTKAGQSRYYLVPIPYVTRIGEALQIAEAEDLTKAIQRLGRPVGQGAQ